MSARRWELVTADEPTVVSELLPDMTVVEDGQSDRRFPDSPCTNERDWSAIFCEADDLLDQFVASETDPWWWGRHFSGSDAVQE